MKNDFSVFAKWDHYVVTFLDGDGTQFATQNVSAGEKAHVPEGEPTKVPSDGAVYRFARWETSFDDPINSDITIVPVFEKITGVTATFFNGDGSVLDAVTVPLGGNAETSLTPTKQDDSNTVFTFTGWDKSTVGLMEDTSFYPQFSSAIDDTIFSYVETGDGTVSVTGFNSSWKSRMQKITIPSELGGQTVEMIGDSAFAAKRITSLVMPDTITYIGVDSFFNCYFEEVHLSTSLQSVGTRAFQSCGSLKSLDIPASLTVIETDAFGGASALTTLTLHEGLKTVKASAFSGCVNLTELALPSTLEYVQDQAFYECGALTSLTIPSSVKTIGTRAFGQCRSLTEIHFPASTINIGDYAFQGCGGVKTVFLPGSITEEQLVSLHSAFSWLSGVTSIKFDGEPKNMKFENGCLFSTDGSVLLLYARGSARVSYTMPEAVKRIAAYAFQNATNLKTIEFQPTGSLEFGERSFYGSGLTSLFIPSYVTEIPDYCFNETDIKVSFIPSSVVTMGHRTLPETYKAKLFCEAASKPAGWASDWFYGNPSYVVWGSTLSQAEEALNA